MSSPGGGEAGIVLEGTLSLQRTQDSRSVCLEDGVLPRACRAAEPPCVKCRGTT